MAELITVSTEQMQETLNTFNSQKGAQATAYTNIKSAINSVVYEGEACTAFMTQFNQFYNNISMSEAKMADAVDELAKAQNLYVGAEIERLKTEAAALQVGRDPFAS